MNPTRGEIRVGLFLTNQQPPGTDLVAALDEQLALVRFVGDMGWDSVWAGQHYLTDSLAMLQPVPFLARLAAESGSMRVGMGVLLLGLHNPVEVAEVFASLDIISGGRLVFGVGLGYREAEFDAFGLGKGERVRRFEQNLELVKRLWTEESVDADLPGCRLEGATLLARPVQKPRPPIWTAANADAAVERAARLSDAWLVNPHATVATIQRQLGLFDSARAAAGLPPPDERPALREIHCAPTRAQAIDRVRPHLERKYRAYADWGQDRALPGRTSFRVPFDELARDRFILGSPEDCLAQLRFWRDELGINHFVFRTDWVGMPAQAAMESLKLLSAEVLPALRAGQ